MTDIKVGIVEDEMIIARGISKAISELGYIPLEPASNYTEALEMIERDRPDILLLDINLAGHKDGIDLAWAVKEKHDIPFIFLTANSDVGTVERVKELHPPAYLIKPFNKTELYTSIEICLHNFSGNKKANAELDKGNYVINDSLFIKQAHNFVKVKIEDILYLESDRVYVIVHTRENKFLVRSTIQAYMELIGSRKFIRTHRSYAINIDHLELVNTEMLRVKDRELPMGKAYRDNLLAQLRLG